MKKILLILMLLCVVVGTKAQMAKWLIKPSYDKIALVSGIDGVITDSAGVKTIWTLNGKRLITSKDNICPFKEGLALAIKSDSTISIIYKQNGESMKLDGCKITYNHPYYSSGKLLVKKGKYYKYVDDKGNILVEDYINAFPFMNGYAACETYLNLEKKKDLRHMLLDDKGKRCEFSFQGKKFGNDDIQFVSSVNDENIAVVVFKQKVYFFNGKDKELTPVLADDNLLIQNLKEQAKISSEFEESFVREEDSTYKLTMKCGKNTVLTIGFDSMMRPIYRKQNDKEHTYKNKVEAKKTWNTDLKITKGKGVSGLSWSDGKEILPPQFDEVLKCFDNKAFVKMKGKVGMLEVLKGESFKLKINKGDDIAFRHQKFETTIRVDFPTFLKADKVNIEIDSQSGCNIDKTSKTNKNTDNGNFVQYNCVLNIPSDLPDELKTIEYPVTILYDGFKSSVIPFKVKAWHYKYFVVDIDESQTSLDNGNVSFVFNINAERIASDAIYPTTVNIITDSLTFEYEKMSEIRHKCKVYSLKEGVNNIIVQVVEQGCPPASFPFEVEYYKPVAKTKNKPAEKEKVTIKKKAKAPKRSEEKEVRPRVIM